MSADATQDRVRIWPDGFVQWVGRRGWSRIHRLPPWSGDPACGTPIKPFPRWNAVVHMTMPLGVKCRRCFRD